MRLIDADALEDSLGVEDEDITFKEVLRNAPTVDAVLVVRCGECKQWSKRHDCNGNILIDGHCDYWHGRRHSMDFCSYGERKDGEKI